MRRCPGCGYCMDTEYMANGWHTVRTGDTSWRVAEWQGGNPTGRETNVTYGLASIAACVRDALNEFARLS